MLLAWILSKGIILEKISSLARGLAVKGPLIKRYGMGTRDREQERALAVKPSNSSFDVGVDTCHMLPHKRNNFAGASSAAATARRLLLDRVFQHWGRKFKVDSARHTENAEAV